MALISKKANLRTEDEKSWDKLVDQIWAGNVIPVIGDNLVVENTTIVKELIEYLAEDKGLKYIPNSFSELYYDKDFIEYQSTLYEEVSSLIRANQEGFHPTNILERFLSIEQFPFVITTSVDYTVEETMKRIWDKRGRKVRTLVFRNDASENDDIRSDSDIKEPTVYYMFGKADNNREHSFVLTEEDMLAFCQSWLSDSHPALLTKVIGRKYLLFLGVNYPDWLIRFMWFSMRRNLKDSGMLVDQRELESSLMEFFRRVSIRTQMAPNVVIEEIISRLAEKKEEYEQKKFDHVQENTDFFISYSRRDAAYAELLYKELTSQGYNVWYDRNDIAVGSEWEIAIRRGIRTTKKFIALISDNMEVEVRDHHPYRVEWDIALAHRINDKTFVIPVCIGSISIYNNEKLRLPEDLTHIQAIEWTSFDVVSRLAEQILFNIGNHVNE